MRVVVTGATGNVGTSVVEALSAEPAIEEIVGLARRRPDVQVPKTRHVTADIRTSDLAALFAGADAVVHLAWLIQPSRQRDVTRSVNVDGSRRVFEAVAQAGVPALVYSSSVGAYSLGPKDRAVDESWPTDGTPTSFYARDKAQVEQDLDDFEREHPGVRVVRLRPGLIFKREAGAEIQRLFVGPLLPRALVRKSLIPVVPAMDRLRFQTVHSKDIGQAFALAVTGDARGAFNVAAEPVLDADELGRILGARPVRVAPRVLRGVMNLSWRLHLQPTPPGWLDMALTVPLMDTRRAREELGWSPRFGADEALLDLLDGLRGGDGIATPPLAPA
jgi:nucleoside-diphosphate-sugar epimerase